MSSDNPALRETTHEFVGKGMKLCSCGERYNVNDEDVSHHSQWRQHVSALRETRPAQAAGSAAQEEPAKAEL